MNEEDGEKINHEGGGGARSYTAMLPTEHRIIFSWAVALNSVGNVRWYFLNFPLKFENPSRFSKSVGTSVDKQVSEHARIEFAASVGKCADQPRCLTVARTGICIVRR